MKYCNYRDVTSVYSLNSRKLPGRFSYTAWERGYCSSGSRGGSEDSMEPPFQGSACTEKFIRSGTARPYMQGRKAYMFEIIRIG